MAFKFNPFTKNLDYHSHAGILSYTSLGLTAEDPPVTDPGAGNFVLNESGDSYQLVINTTDKNGRDLGYVLMMLFMIGFGDIYHVWFWIHSKRDPRLYYGMWIFIDEIDTIEDGEGNVLAWILPMFPIFVSMTYDPEADEYTGLEIPVNDEVLLSMDFAFNPDYIGTMGTQDYDDVYITGGSISGVSFTTVDDVIIDLATKGLVLKDTQATPHYWRVTISNVGALVTSDLGTSI